MSNPQFVKALLFEHFADQPRWVDLEIKSLEAIYNLIDCDETPFGKGFQAINLDPYGEKPGLALFIDENARLRNNKNNNKPNNLLAKYAEFPNILGNALLVNNYESDYTDIKQEDIDKFFLLLSFCRNCLKKNERLLKCGRCHKINYCSKECQKTDWTRHRSKCK